MKPWYAVDNIDEIDSPALLVYEDRVKTNIANAIEMAGGPHRLCPHVKTHKMAEVARMMVEAGIQLFKSATIAEAEMLAMENAAKVLIAHQPVGPKAKRILALMQKYPKTLFYCLVDNPVTAKELSALFEASKRTVGIYFDINIGMNRSGIPAADALALFEQIKSLPALQLVGLHGYDGHIRDQNFEQRKARTDLGYAQILDLKNQLERLQSHSLQIIIGGSPSFPTHAKRADLVCSPGTFVFWDWTYHQIDPASPFAFAALVITRIISIIDEETVCADLGHKGIAAENPLPRIHFLNADNLTPFSQSEEHLVLKLSAGKRFQVGDLLYGVPYHVCPTVALYETAQVVTQHQVTQEWPVIARKRKISV